MLSQNFLGWIGISFLSGAGPINGFLGEHSPTDPGEFVGQGNYGDISVGARLEGIDPNTELVPVAVRM